MAIGPCLQVIQAGDFIYVSGQIGVDPVSGAVVQGAVDSIEDNYYILYRT